MSSTPPQGRPDQHATLFLTTHWSVVLAARSERTTEASRALESLCRAYWQPLYVYARRRGHAPQDAEDLTQGFFAKLLEKDWLAAVEQERGRFRQFLLMAFKRFLANEHDHAQRLKRGGGAHAVPLDTVLGEKLYREETSPAASADAVYDKHWALSLLDATLSRLRSEFEASGRAREFEILKPQLTAPRGDTAYADLARELQTTEGAARVAVHRLRKRFREVFREQIAHTVGSADELDSEVRHLISALARET
ncbi:RNA polymerase subunit sigma-24 [Verrucomicrobiaceae bacterium SCGC AG-212-N21]|nr:RNA polymerase subunit sigma-24 [Verrucomicrobiaceae bacterium SCGC AG-212-N21]